MIEMKNNTPFPLLSFENMVVMVFCLMLLLLKCHCELKMDFMLILLSFKRIVHV